MATRAPVLLLFHHPRFTERELEITPHEAGFKVWDAFSPSGGPLVAGRYRIILRTTGGQLMGRAALRVVE
jgi:hypothetical protein